MKGVITKRHFFQVVATFGLRAGLRLLFTRQQTALTLLWRF